MRNSLRIVKKELDKIFKFPRMIFTTLLLPGLIIFMMYAFIGNSIQSETDKAENRSNVIHVINAPDSLEFAYDLSDDLKVEFVNVDINTVNELKDKLFNEEVELIVIYENGFEEKVRNHEFPKVEILYNSLSTNSRNASYKFNIILETQKNNLYSELGINPNIFETTRDTIENAEKGATQFLAMLLPILVMSFIFASAMSVGSDAIAGEKERGTLPTMLMMPIKRREIIVGKIISTTLLTVFSAMSSFIGIIASLPFSKPMFGIEGGINYGFLEYFGLAVVLILISAFASSILLITSTLAKTTKEAATMSLPFYIVAMLIPVITMSSTSGKPSLGLYFIPIYNTILVLKEILTFSFNPINFLLTITSSVIYISFIIYILINMFKSEKILYSK